jgi:membrane protein YdbS with pleckstrin-like domain
MLAHLARLIAALLIAFVSLLPNAYAPFECGQCGSADPFKPFGFVISVAAYALIFWIVISPRAKRYRNFIYRSLVLLTDEYHRALKVLASATAAGLLLSLLTIIPVFAGYGDTGGSGGGIGGGEEPVADRQ